MRWLFLLFVVLPFVEMVVLIEVGIIIGSIPAALLVFVNAIMGTFLLQRQGFKTVSNFNTRLEKGELPAREVVSGVLLIPAGICLLIPGFVTDVVGLLLLFSLCRNALASYIIKKGQLRVLKYFEQFENLEFILEVFQKERPKRSSAGNIVVLSELKNPAAEVEARSESEKPEAQNPAGNSKAGEGKAEGYTETNAETNPESGETLP